jgi:hypothetical protein
MSPLNWPDDRSPLSEQVDMRPAIVCRPWPTIVCWPWPAIGLQAFASFSLQAFTSNRFAGLGPQWAFAPEIIMIKNILTKRKESNTYLANVSRHHWSS